MQDEAKTKGQLIFELKALRQRVGELEKGTSTDPAELRRRAEEGLKARQTETDQLETHDTERLHHELAVHQIELEMQNEELRNALVQVEESCTRYSDLYDFAPVGYLTLDENGVVLEANLTIARQLGIERSRLVGVPLSSHNVIADRNSFRSHLSKVLKDKTHQACEVRFLKNGEGNFHALLDTIFVEDAGGKGRLRTSVIDISERRLMEEELCRSRDELELRVQERTASLEKANEELRQIPSRLIAVLEEERKRLANELHDSIGQTLAAVKFQMEMVLKLRNEVDGSAALNRLEQFVPILQQSIEETRRIYMGLRPTMLDSMGLLATLEWLRHECMKLYPQRHIELESGVAEEEIPGNLKVNIFRIAQEALNNIAKHSEAEWVDISLSKNAGGIELVVSDDGVGMNLDTISQTSAVRGLGLTTMRERAELTGGSFSIESTPGEGTTVRACWPIEAQDQLQKGGIT